MLRVYCKKFRKFSYISVGKVEQTDDGFVHGAQIVSSVFVYINEKINNFFEKLVSLF